MKKYVVLFSLAIAAFVGFKTAHAADLLVGQNIDSYFTDNTCNGTYPCSLYVPSSSLSSLSENLSSLYLHLQEDVPSRWGVHIFTSCSGNVPSSCSNDYLLNLSTSSVVGTYGGHNINENVYVSSTTLPISGDIVIGMYEAYGFQVAGHNGSTISGQYYREQDGSTPSFTPYLQLYGDGSSGVGGITFTEPLPSSTIAGGGFPDWIVNITGLAGDNWNVSVNYGLSSSSLSYTDSYITNDPRKPVYIPVSVPLWSPPLSSPVTWYAKATATNGSTTLSTSLISFSVLAPTSVFFNQNTSTTNAGLPTFNKDCSVYSVAIFSSTTIPALECYGELFAFNVTQILFAPDQWAVNWLQNGISNFKHTFPFSVPFAISDAVSTAASSTSGVSSSTDYTLSLPVWNDKFVVVLGSSTLPSLVGSTTARTILDVEKAGIWGGTGVALLLILW